MRDRSSFAFVVLVIVSAGCTGKDVKVLNQPDAGSGVCAQFDQPCGSSMPCCGIYVCSNIAGSNICAESQLPHKRMFVTSSTYGGNLGGISGGNSLCQSSATQAALGGTWKAWLSDANTDAINNLVDAGPWFLLNGTKVFENKAGLSNAPLAALDLDEHGALVMGGSFYVWTGTLFGGLRGSTHCLSWTATAPETAIAGYGGVQTVEWTDNGPGTLCEASNHLYCIEQ